MKIWDCFPAYLSQSQLIAEHRELHGLQQLIDRGKTLGQGADPHIANWLNAPQAIAWRHALVVEEMRLQLVDHKSPIDSFRVATEWPAFSKEVSITVQFEQLKALATDARLNLPGDPKELMQQSAFSFMARDPAYYKHLQAEVMHERISVEALFKELCQVVRRPVQQEVYERVINTMWRYCQKAPEAFTFKSSQERPARRIRAIQFLASKYRWPELWHSTALTDFACCAISDE